jgi:hypothetical protein
MLDHPDYPDPETSGSAFFCFAMAWGVRNGLLDSASYDTCITKAWRDLVKNVGADGRLLRCQHVDWMPETNLSADVNNSSPEGEGAFLQAGYEMYLKAATATAANPVKPASIVKRPPFVMHGDNIAFTSALPAQSSLKIFFANGRLAADLSQAVKLMRGNPNRISCANLRLTPGVYRIVLEHGDQTASVTATLIR